jgi:hypothetical protein
MKKLPPLIEVIGCESGDWSVLRVNKGKDFLFEGHSIPDTKWMELIEFLGYKVFPFYVTDEEMENGDY